MTCCGVGKSKILGFFGGSDVVSRHARQFIPHAESRDDCPKDDDRLPRAFTKAPDKAYVDDTFACYERKVTVRAKEAIGDET